MSGLDKKFNEWWNSDELLEDNPYSIHTPKYWAWEGWVAGVRAEREACAKLCEQPIDEIQITDDCSEYKYRDNQECADAIRARGSDAA